MSVSKHNITYNFNHNVKNISKPVLVFVHGYDSTADIWRCEENSIVSDAVRLGYRTAITNLNSYDSIETNGMVLSAQLKEILLKYDVEKTVVICHCKGGIDIQSAIYYNNADVYIHFVITLSTPHWGTPLADIIFTNNIPSNQNTALKHRVKAMFDMQTLRMMTFRHVFDNDPRCSQVPFFTIATTETDKNMTVFKDEQQMFMNMFGPNDSMIPVSYAKKPGALHIATLPVSHSGIVRYEYIWKIIEPYIQGIHHIKNKTPRNYTLNTPSKIELMNMFKKITVIIQKQKRTEMFLTGFGICLLLISIGLLWWRHKPQPNLVIKNMRPVK